MLLPEDAGQRSYSLREVFNGLRWMVRAGMPWRMMPNDLPPWYVVYQQTQRWLAAGCFSALVDDLRLLLREAKGRNRQPRASIFDSRTLQSTPESGTVVLESATVDFSSLQKLKSKLLVFQE
jgi:transposase